VSTKLLFSIDRYIKVDVGYYLTIKTHHPSQINFVNTHPKWMLH